MGHRRIDLRRITPWGGAFMDQGWSPDGQWIVFSLTHDGMASIYMVRPDGTSLTQITTEPGVDEQQPVWTNARG